MPTAATSYYSRKKLVPIYPSRDDVKQNVALSPNLTLPLGQVLSESATPGTFDLYLAAPPAPVLSTATTGGTVAAGTYDVVISYTNTAVTAESAGSVVASVTTTGTTSTITIPSPPAAPGATYWYAYVTQAGSGSATRQEVAGLPSNLGAAVVLTAPPTSTGAAPLTSATAPAKGILEYACTTDAFGNITINPDWGVTFPSASVYLPNSGVAYNAADLVGLDQAAVTNMGGSVAQGTISAGVVVI